MVLYEITLDRAKLNDYQVGEINGIFWALTGMPRVWYGRQENKEHTRCILRHEANREDFIRAYDVINELYPGVIISSKEIDI